MTYALPALIYSETAPSKSGFHFKNDVFKLKKKNNEEVRNLLQLRYNTKQEININACDFICVYVFIRVYL